MVKVFLDKKFRVLLSKIQDNVLKEKIGKHIRTIRKNPRIGKPMRYARKGTRELPIKPFRLSYVFNAKEDGRRPMVYGGFMRQAAEGFVCIVTKNTPCFRCCMQLQGESFRTLHREPGLGLDISMVAHFMAKIIIAMLDKSEGEFAQPVRAAVHDGKNILHISNRTGLFNQEPFSLTWLAAERQRCEICNQPNS